MPTSPLHELRNHPRPLAPREAADLLDITEEQLTALNLPYTEEPDGTPIYDSGDVMHWYDIKRTDPEQFSRRIATYHGEQPHP